MGRSGCGCRVASGQPDQPELTATGAAADLQGAGTVSLAVVSPPGDLPKVGVFELPFPAGPASVRPVTDLLPDVDAVAG